MTWSSPIVFHNNFSSDNKTYYQPLTNKYVNENNVDNYTLSIVISIQDFLIQT